MSQASAEGAAPAAHVVVGRAVPRPDLEEVAVQFHQSPRHFLDNILDGPGEFDFEDALSEYLFLVLIGFVFGAMVPVLPPALPRRSTP